MNIWNSIYPGTGQPTEHTTNTTLTSKGLNFVRNVVLENLGSSGVIVINGTSSDYLLVYKTTFINPQNTDESVNGRNGGAISCFYINCVQIDVCSYGAYCTEYGAHSYIIMQENSNNKCHLFGCSFSKSTGYESVFSHENGTQHIKSTNISFCQGALSVGGSLYGATGNATINFVMYSNLTSTIYYWHFSYSEMTINIFQTIYIYNKVNIYRFGFIFCPRNGIAVFKDCIIKDNDCGGPLLDGNYQLINCLIDNFGYIVMTAKNLHFELEFLSTFLCAGNIILLKNGSIKNIQKLDETIGVNYEAQKIFTFLNLGILPIVHFKYDLIS